MLEIAGMEAAGVPWLDVERLRLVRYSTRGVGQCGPRRQDKSKDLLPTYAGAAAEERSAHVLWGVGSSNCALGTLAY